MANKDLYCNSRKCEQIRRHTEEINGAFYRCVVCGDYQPNEDMERNLQLRRLNLIKQGKLTISEKREFDF